MTRKPDYSLQGRLTNELINLYGIPIKLLLTEKLDYDSNVFGDYSSVKVDKEKVFQLYGLPENSDEWDDIGVNFSEFGMLNVENIRLFISSKSVNSIFDSDPIKGLQSNLIILPNDRMMEITDVNFQVPGINNLYTYKDDKNVYKITLKTYQVKLTDDIEEVNTETIDKETYEQLDTYFDELTNTSDSVENESENIDDIETEKPVLKKSDDPVFGRF